MRSLHHRCFNRQTCRQLDARKLSRLTMPSYRQAAMSPLPRILGKRTLKQLITQFVYGSRISRGCGECSEPHRRINDGERRGSPWSPHATQTAALILSVTTGPCADRQATSAAMRRSHDTGGTAPCVRKGPRTPSDSLEPNRSSERSAASEKSYDRKRARRWNKLRRETDRWMGAFFKRSLRSRKQATNRICAPDVVAQGTKIVSRT
jgi:hypothetical protein